MSKKPAHHPSVLRSVCLIILIISFVSYLSLLLFWHVSAIAILGFQYLDNTWMKDLYMIRSPFLTDFMFFITLFGADLTIILGTIITYFFKRMDRKRESIIFGTAGIIGFILTFVLKYIFARNRPDMSVLVVMDSFSYPSGHSMNAFIFYGLLAYYTIVFTKREVLEVAIAVISIGMIILIGISRVYLGVHYPTDVIAGYIGGLWVVIGAVWINSLYLKR